MFYKENIEWVPKEIVDDILRMEKMSKSIENINKRVRARIGEEE